MKNFLLMMIHVGCGFIYCRFTVKEISSKKLIKIIMVCVLAFSLVGCGKSYQEATNNSVIQKGDSECSGYFTKIVSWGADLYKIVYANDTKVKYFMRDSGHGWSITPLYNTDGTLQVYEGE